MSISWNGGVLIIRGEFDQSNSHAIVLAIDHTADMGETEITLLMEGCTFCGSPCVGAIVHAVRRGLAVTVLRPSRQVRQVLEITGVDLMSEVTISDI